MYLFVLFFLSFPLNFIYSLPPLPLCPSTSHSALSTLPTLFVPPPLPYVFSVPGSLLLLLSCFPRAVDSAVVPALRLSFWLLGGARPPVEAQGSHSVPAHYCHHLLLSPVSNPITSTTGTSLHLPPSRQEVEVEGCVVVRWTTVNGCLGCST